MGRLADVSEIANLGMTVSEENPEGQTVNTTPTQVLKNDGERLSYTLVNLSDNTIYVAHTNSVSSTNGIPLQAKGGFVTLDVTEDGERVGRELWAIADTASGSVYIVTTKAVN